MKPLRHGTLPVSHMVCSVFARPSVCFCLHMHSMAVDNEHVCVVCVWVLVGARKGCARAGVVIARRTL